MGTYLSVDGETQISPWKPIQPRTEATITLEEWPATGIVFEGGQYQTFEDFDPVVTRVITEDARLEMWQTEPDYEAGGWVPATWGVVNTVRTLNGRQQQLVVIPGQYRSENKSIGTERLFTSMTYTVYYSNTADTIPPSIWVVAANADDNLVEVTVEATDFSAVKRVAIAYTIGDGQWKVTDLVKSDENDSLWTGVFSSQEPATFFVQAVDGGGNVTTNDNKGRYFSRQHNVYLPLIMKVPDSS
jgi:hypothetical protein